MIFSDNYKGYLGKEVLISFSFICILFLEIFVLEFIFYSLKCFHLWKAFLFFKNIFNLYSYQFLCLAYLSVIIAF